LLLKNLICPDWYLNFKGEPVLMTKTDSRVVAVFRDLPTAQAAADELIANAFAEDHIYISPESSNQDLQESVARLGTIMLTLVIPQQTVDIAADILNHHSPVKLRLDESENYPVQWSTASASRS
jgi:hypothetical protein